MGLVVVNDEVNGTGIENSIKTLGAGLGDGARNLRANGVLGERRHREDGVVIKVLVSSGYLKMCM